MPADSDPPPGGNFRERLASLETEVDGMGDLLKEMKHDLRSLMTDASKTRGAILAIGVLWTVAVTVVGVLLRK